MRNKHWKIHLEIIRNFFYFRISIRIEHLHRNWRLLKYDEWNLWPTYSQTFFDPMTNQLENFIQNSNIWVSSGKILVSVSFVFFVILQDLQVKLLIFNNSNANGSWVKIIFNFQCKYLKWNDANCHSFFHRWNANCKLKYWVLISNQIVRESRFNFIQFSNLYPWNENVRDSTFKLNFLIFSTLCRKKI